MVKVEDVGESAISIANIVVTSAVMVLLGLVFFLINLWIIKESARLLGFATLTADMAVISAAILSAAGVVGPRKH